jgi:hypothetical protein
MKVRINSMTNGIVIVAKSSFVSTACLFWTNTISDNNKIIRITTILAFLIFRNLSLSVIIEILFANGARLINAALRAVPPSFCPGPDPTARAPTDFRATHPAGYPADRVLRLCSRRT